MPASVFSRSTECHNQDKVSMGTIAARDCVRVLQLTEQVTAAVLLAACQALELRIQAGEFKNKDLSAGMRDMLQQVREVSPFLEEDRALENELRALVAQLQQQALTAYEAQA